MEDLDVDMLVHSKAGHIFIPRAGRMRPDIGPGACAMEASAAKTAMDACRRDGCDGFNTALERQASGRYLVHVYPRPNAPAVVGMVHDNADGADPAGVGDAVKRFAVGELARAQGAWVGKGGSA